MTWSWHGFWLFLHIYAAIIAFGPTFVFPVVGPWVAKNPQFALPTYHIFELIENRLILPFALTMPVSGIGLLGSTSIDLFHTPWLLSGISLYLVALLIAFFNQVPATAKAIGILQGMGASAAPDGPPPPALMTMVNRARIGGMILSLLLVTIVILMVTKPGTTGIR